MQPRKMVSILKIENSKTENYITEVKFFFCASYRLRKRKESVNLITDQKKIILSKRNMIERNMPGIASNCQTK